MPRLARLLARTESDDRRQAKGSEYRGYQASQTLASVVGPVLACAVGAVRANVFGHASSIASSAGHAINPGHRVLHSIGRKNRLADQNGSEHCFRPPQTRQTMPAVALAGRELWLTAHSPAIRCGCSVLCCSSSRTSRIRRSACWRITPDALCRCDSRDA